VRAAIDIGTNTVRLVLGEGRATKVVPERYYRKITRLGGGFAPDKGLSPEAMERTLCALKEIAEILENNEIDSVRAVGTAALRNARNGRRFADTIRSETGIRVEIIDGGEEARLCASGVLTALSPRPEYCLVFDIGGGSTEFILCRDTSLLFHRSYPLGVVTLCEQFPSVDLQRKRIDEILKRFLADLEAEGMTDRICACTLVGTAGTVTTLAALQLGMDIYDWRRINNVMLLKKEIEALAERMAPLSPSEREALPGMEKGRGDLILPGLRLVSGIMERLEKDRLTVSDFGLLEGVLLENHPRELTT
jgi:exopolyphosphatase/guanosine-5'-triphosphate,3'-diphosphate pyrophosphatase